MSTLTDEFTNIKRLEAQARTNRAYWSKRRRFLERLLIDREKLKKIRGELGAWYDFVKGSLSEDERSDFEEIVKGKKSMKPQ